MSAGAGIFFACVVIACLLMSLMGYGKQKRKYERMRKKDV